MARRTKRAERLLALFIIGVLLLNFPILRQFSQDGLLFGVPILYLYIFVVWLLLIIVTAYTIYRS